MKRFFGLLFIVILLLLPSCTPVGGNKTLGEIEGFMQERPDSALAALRGIHPGKLSSRRYKAWHALLLSEALDKNYVDLTDDSIALRAHDYFVSHGDRLHRMKSWYYLGRIRFNAGNYAEAVICYQRALKYADAAGDYHYMGLINREISNSYGQTWDNNHALQYAIISSRYFKESGENNYYEYNQLAMARMYRGLNNADRSIIILDSLIQNSRDNYLIAEAYRTTAYINAADSSVSPVIPLSYFYRAFKDSLVQMHTLDYSTMSFLYAKVGKQDSSLYYLNKAKNSRRSNQDAITVDYYQYKIADLEGDYKTANKLLERTVFAQDSSVYAALDQSLAFYQSNYYQNESRKNALAARNRSYLLGLIVCFFLSVTGLLFYRNRRNIKRLIEEIAQTTGVRDELSEVKSYNKSLSQTVADLFEERLQILQGLSDQYDQLDEKQMRKLRAKEGEPSKDEIIASFRKNLKKLREDAELTRSMNEILNASQDGIMTKFERVFRSNVPEDARMTEEDLEIVPYFFSGMKQKTISYLIGSAESTIRVRKHRIKKKIEALDDQYSEEKELFLRHLVKDVT